MIKNFFFLIFLLFLSTIVFAQENFPVNGVVDKRANIYLLKNATIIPGADQEQMVGDILIKEGKIVKIAAEIKEKGAIEVDLKGYFVYPSFIDLYAQYGLSPVKSPNVDTQKPQLQSNTPGAFASNESIRSEYKAYMDFQNDAIEAENWRKSGYGVVLTHRMDGISRGSGSLVAMADLNEHEVILKEVASNHLSLRKGSSTQDYPGSQMGAIALLRQTFYDGEAYARKHKDLNITLDSWNKLQSLPTIIEAPNLLGIFRVDKIGDEFGKQFIVKSSGDEYKRLAAVKATNASLIVPVNYPLAIDAEDPWDAEQITIDQMKHWELAPYNLKMLQDKGIVFSITSDDLKDKTDLLKNVRSAVKNGLSEVTALNALTITPAMQIGMQNELGSISIGKWANLIVTDQPVFEDDAKIIQNWVIGSPYQIQPFINNNIEGEYELRFGNQQVAVTIEGNDMDPKLTVHLNDTTDLAGNITFKNNSITISFAIPEENKLAGYVTLSGWQTKDGNYEGKGRTNNGEKISWKAIRTKALVEKGDEEEDEEEEKNEIGEVIYPFTAYGWSKPPTQEKVLFKGATVWTNEEDGILKDTDVLIEKGKIVKIGRDLNANDAIVVIAKDKHLTSGIIDEHSHIGIQGGVNEWAKASSAEVSIGDVINSEDVNFYRQLAGGVVAAQLLHGSANPIGGQSTLVKFRWGSLPEEMKIKGADGFIKFALGENVKQSNWSQAGERFPQTRMGVEQVFIDHFTRAKAYMENKDPDKRIDIELEALAEILNKERFITCHSYVQSEINMMMKVAESFGFRVNTFTHILEGYKVADIMKEHGAGASTFSDWWAYKFEVKDAIPYNAAILNEMGVLTAINSDDAEMGRRLNQEAAKTVKYGGVSEEEAWKMITLNPAKLLHLEDHMGSIKVGKDADIVLWSDHPLSIYAKPEQTYVDGIKYYDLQKDIELRAELEKERARLIQKMLLEKKGGAKTTKVEPVKEEQYHCDDLEDWHKEKELE